MMLAEVPLSAAQLPPDDIELASVPAGAEEGDEATPGLPLETSRVPDVESGMQEGDRWQLELSHDEGTAAAAVQHISETGLRMIENFEGFSPVRAPDPIGIPTIGYGTTAADIFPLPATCTRAQAEGWLRSKMASKYEPAVRGLGIPLNQHQFDALCSFVYNLGGGSMSSSWTIGRLLRARQYRAAADSMLMYDRAAGMVLPGLVRRRQEERALFLTPMPAVADPNHLERFPNATFDIDGHRINERETVARFYSLLEHPAANHNQLVATQANLVLLRKRVWAVSHFQKPPSWGSDWRGWRWQVLNKLTKERV